MILIFFHSSSAVNSTDGSGFVISCQSNHIYCFRCLYNAMNRYLAAQSTPLCHSTSCDYQLSRHDLAYIPLTQRMFRQLSLLVKTQRRPQCPRCHFYVDLQEIVDLDQHIESCHPEDVVPCEYCNCPQELTLYEEHCRQCRNDRSGRQENLVNFILPRTKYPFTAKQIDYFIETKKKTKSNISPLSIVEELAQYGEFLRLILIPHYMFILV